MALWWIPIWMWTFTWKLKTVSLHFLCVSKVCGCHIKQGALLYLWNILYSSYQKMWGTVQDTLRPHAKFDGKEKWRGKSDLQVWGIGLHLSSVCVCVAVDGNLKTSIGNVEDRIWKLHRHRGADPKGINDPAGVREYSVVDLWWSISWQGVKRSSVNTFTRSLSV